VTAKCIFRFDGAHGGQLVEFDDRKGLYNWQNTLTRRKEAYHQHLLENKPPKEAVAEEEGIDTIHHAAADVDDRLRDAIVYDWYLKNSFVDHISDTGFNADSFQRCHFREFGDFADQPFEMELDKKQVTFSRHGGLYFPDKEETLMRKIYTPTKNGFDFEILLETEAKDSFNYVLEHNLHFAEYAYMMINGQPLAEEGEFTQIKSLSLYDAYLDKEITFMLDQPFDLYYFQLKTLSQSEQGFDLSVQGISLAMVIPFSKVLHLNGTLEVSDV